MPGPPAMLVVEVFRELGRELTKEVFELTLNNLKPRVNNYL